jgi:hypothetical protein
MMDEKESPARPNEGIPLSENRIGEEGLPYYYSREHRLSRAPDSVRALYEEKAPPKFNLLRPLLSTRPNAVLFATMMVLALITLVVGFSGIGSREQDYYGNRVSVSAARYDGAAVITLKKNRRPGGIAYTGVLDVAVFPQALAQAGDSGIPPAAYPYHISFSSREAEEFRFSVPFEETELVVKIFREETGEDGSLAFKVKAK